MDPLNCEFMVAVLTRIDAELGVHNTAAEQQQFFENLLASQPLYFSTVKAVSARGPNDMKLLDADSCLAKPKRLIRDRMEAGNYATRIARVFAEGSACFPPTFLTAIEYTRNAEESSSAQGRLAHPTVEDITPKSAAGIDEVVSSDESDDEVSENQSDQDDTYVEGVRPSRKRKEGPATDEKTTNKKQKTTDHPRKRPHPSNFPPTTEETSAVNAQVAQAIGMSGDAPPTKKRKRPHQDGDDLQPPGSRKSPKLSAPSLPRPSTAASSSGTRFSKDSLQTQTKTPSTHDITSKPMNDAIDPISEGARDDLAPRIANGTTAEGAEQGQQTPHANETQKTSATAAQNHQARQGSTSNSEPNRTTASEDAARSASQREEIFPGEVNTDAAENSRLSKEDYQPADSAPKPPMFNPGKVLGIPGEDMRTMYAVLNRAITNTAGYLYTDLEHKGPGGLYIGSPTNLEPRPIAALRELYAQIFGHAWENTLPELTATGNVDMQTLLEALICAFLTIKVFRKKLPWNSPMDCLTDPSLAPMDKYFRRCLEAKRVKYEKVVHAAAFDQIKDEEFQNTTVMEAAEVLTTEFAFTVMDQITLFRKGRTPTDGWYRRFLDNLKDVFWNALIMRGQFEASMDNFIIQWRWPKEPFDIDTMTTPSGHFSNKGAPVQYTILPAIVRHDYGSKGPGITAFRAMVSLNSKDIVGISKRG